MNPVAEPQASMQNQQHLPPLHSSFQASQQPASQAGAQNQYQGMMQPGMQPTVHTMVPKHSTEEAPGAPTGDIMLVQEFFLCFIPIRVLHMGSPWLKLIYLFSPSKLDPK